MQTPSSTAVLSEHYSELHYSNSLGSTMWNDQRVAVESSSGSHG